MERADADVTQAPRQRGIRRRNAIRMWLGFDGMMLGLRGLTYGQKTRILPVPDVAGGGVHIHHFVWGIVILATVGFIALTSPDASANPKLALLFGVGAALVADEFALWLTLSDVYFAPEGVWSLELAGLVAALLGLNAGVAAADLRRHEDVMHKLGDRRVAAERHSAPNRILVGRPSAVQGSPRRGEIDGEPAPEPSVGLRSRRRDSNP